MYGSIVEVEYALLKMKNKILFIIAFLVLFFLVLTVPLVKASPIKNLWYNTLSFLGIIEITDANHLNSDRVVISDIYEEVKELDELWSEIIPDGNYVRITFEKNLTNENDITIYPRIVSGNPKIEVYEKDKNELITEFSSISSNQYNKVFLTNLKNRQDSFDLKVLNGSVEFNHIIDPIITEITPNSTVNIAWNGTLEENTYTYVSRTPLATANYVLLQNIGTGFFAVPGQSTTVDVFVEVNFSLPENYFSMNITSVANQSTKANGAQNLAVWNFTSNAWLEVATGDSVSMVFMSYTTTNFNDFVQNNKVRVMVREQGNAAVALWVDYLGINVSTDTSYPQFSDYWDDNATLTGSGTANFNVTLLNTNGSVFLEINNANITAWNVTANMYNASASLTSGNYTYRWHSWGNDSLNLYNKSIDKIYTVNSSADTCTCPGLNQNWEIDMGDSCNIASNCNLGTGNITFIGTGTTIFNATISLRDLEYPTTDQTLNIGSNAVITIG